MACHRYTKALHCSGWKILFMSNARAKPKPITLKQRVLFLHMAKTAGTSIVHFFQQRLPANALCSHGDFLKFPDDGAALDSQLASYQFLSGHFGYNDIARLVAQTYSFTFLRDPVERVLSFYKFCLHPDMQRQFRVARAARDLGVDGFMGSTLPEVVEALDNLQAWQLAGSYWYDDRSSMKGLSETDLLDLATAHMASFSHVGLTETFDDDFRQILDALDIVDEIPSARQFVTQSPLQSESLKASTLATLRARVAVDEELLNVARSGRNKIS
jgi:hypothetical protein